MSPLNPSYLSALNDFNEARLKASMQEILARLTGKSNELLSYEAVAEKLNLNVRSESGIQEIPLKAIVGSVGRYTDFTRTFLPRKSEGRQRWARVKAAIDDAASTGLPPIDVYKVGEIYFVLDGNHRVSVARREGFEYIEAHVIEVETDVPITPDIQPDDLIIKAEYAEFLAQTNIAALRPGVDLSVTIPGQYEKLLEHIQVHRYFMGLEQQREISYSDAVSDWYDIVYLPIVEPLRDRGLLRWFPERTETDLYLWVSEHRAALESELGWSIRPDAAVTDLVSREKPQAGEEKAGTGKWRLAKMVDRYTDRLFQDILVPLGGNLECWQALEQAILIAQLEKAVLHGLHVVSRKGRIDSDEALAVQTHFDQRCQEAGVNGKLAVVKGNVVKQVCGRALLTDLIIINVLHPPEPGLASLSSGIRAIIRRAARPILSLPGKAGSLGRALVAFDGSNKSKEALFVAAYAVEKWNTALTVLTVTEGGKHPESVQDYARAYLELHEIKADFRVERGSMDSILKVIQESGTDLVMMGSYSGPPMQDVIISSAVNFLLRKATLPLLICR